MKSEYKEIKDELHEDIIIEASRVLNALKPPDSTKAARESKENIYKTISQRIDHLEYSRNPAKARRRQMLGYVLPVASVFVLLLIPLFFIIYNRGYHNASSELANSYIELNAPLGIISNITLPDCTKITLNGGSKLTYPALFGKERRVTLSGEAFFNVSKNEKKPFYVHTHNLTAKVLGTQFNFKAYEGEKYTMLTLEEGSIYAVPAGSSQDEGLILKPSQQIIVNNDTKEMARKRVMSQDFISWRDGIITFRDNTLEEIKVMLERKFNIPIQITTEALKNERYSAQFKHGENLHQILDKLSHKRKWRYKSDNEQIKISLRE